jgi:hypothetical protein
MMKGRHSQWCMLSINFVITCRVTNSSLCGPYGIVILGLKTPIFKKIARWLLLFSEYDFVVIYKPRRFHFMANALSQMPNKKVEYWIEQRTLCFSSCNRCGYRKFWNTLLPKTFRFIITMNKRKS